MCPSAQILGAFERLAKSLEPCQCPVGRLENIQFATDTLRRWPTPVNRQSDKWAVGITTAPRTECPITTCLQSIRVNGWEPIIFAEPGCELIPGTNCVLNQRKRGAWHNWVFAANTLLATGAERILIVQDDTVLIPGVRNYLDRVKWPSDAGFVSLYRSRRQTPDEPPGIRAVTQSFAEGQWRRAGFYWGACAWAFERETLAAILREPLVVHWRGLGIEDDPDRQPHEVKHIDNVIARAAKRAGFRWYAVTPSAAQHVAEYSTIMHGANGKPLGCVGDRAASRIVSDWSFGATIPTTGDAEYDATLAAWSRLFGRPDFPFAQGLWDRLRASVGPGTRVLEFGSGVSTLLMRAAGAEVTSIEQDAVIAATSGAKHCPLNSDGWYEWEPSGGPYDVILIDGPAIRGRDGVVRHIRSLAGPSTVVIVDDTHRRAEAQLAHWIAEILDRRVQMTAADGRGWAVV